MNISIALIISGWAYASACRLSSDVSDTGVARGRTVGLAMTAIGIALHILSA